MRSAATTLVALLALATASCSLPGTGDAPATSAPPAAAPSSEPAAPASSAGTSATASPSAASGSPSAPASGAPTPADPSQPSSGDQLGEVVATRTSSDKGTEVTLTLYPVLRDGATSHVNLELRSPAPEGKSVQISGLLSDGNYSAIDTEGSAADGLQLVDGKNAKLYLVASDGKGQCLCSRSLSSSFLSESAPLLISATFAAPPADVTQVDVRIPAFGTVKNVPVQ